MLVLVLTSSRYKGFPYKLKTLEAAGALNLCH